MYRKYFVDKDKIYLNDIYSSENISLYLSTRENYLVLIGKNKQGLKTHHSNKNEN